MATSISKTDLEAMIDTRYAKLVSDSFAKNAEGTVLVFGHEYIFPQQQKNLYLELEHFLKNHPSMRLFLEGLSEPSSAWPSLERQKEPTATGFRKFLRRFSKPPEEPDRRYDPNWRVSKALQLLEENGRLATEVLAQIYPERVALHGAEDESLWQAQKQKLEEIDSSFQAALSERNFKMATGRFLSSTFTNFFYPIVENLEGHLNDRLKALLALREQFTEDGRTTIYASALASMARDNAIDLDGYPSIQAVTSALELERSIDFQAVEQERMQLVETLARYSEQRLDDPHSRAVRRWLEFAPSQEKALASFYGESAEEELGSVWLRRLITISQAYKDHRYSYSQYNVRLRELLDSLGIEMPETSHLARYIRYILFAEALDANALATSEIWSLHEELADIFTTSTAENGVLKLRTQIEDLYKYALLRLPASRVQSVSAANPSVAQWLADALRLEQSIPHSTSTSDRGTMARNAAAYVDTGFPGIKEFYTLASRRSEKLIENVLRAEPEAHSMAALVCGRFHLYEILRVLRGQAKFSWAVIGPMPTPHSEKQMLQIWNWVNPAQELCLPDLLPESQRQAE